MQKEAGRELLCRMLGNGADFRDGQWEAIDLAANHRKRVLVVQRTGWGKSVVYFLAAKILRDAGSGPALLISPLLSLMRNQILAARNLGIKAVTLHSENVAEWKEIEETLKSNDVDVLLISPERLASGDFQQNLLPLLQGNIGMFVVDEAHCISDWGHDFRPDYRRIVRLLRLLPPSVPVLCTTATANNRVVQDIESQIPNLEILRGPLVRRSLKLFNIRLQDQAERMAWLAHFLPKLPGNGIVYTLTVQDARRVAGWLAQNGIAARAYHADLEAHERIAAENDLLENRVKALVATVALGMGFDKPDLGFVIHFQRPGSVVAYYQQVGRAGRAVDSAFGILLNGREDDQIQDYFIRTAFPTARVMEDIVGVLAKHDGLNVDGLGAELNYPRGAIEKALKLLEVEGAIVREQSLYFRTANKWFPDLARAEQVTRHRRDELAEIQRYVDHPGCLMEFLSQALDDPAAAPCGKCMNCTGKRERQTAPSETIQAAADFLRSDTLVLEPREYWPKSILAEVEKCLPDALDHFENRRAKIIIPERLRAAEGRVLCAYGDAGWGMEVAHGKYGTGVFSEALVEAAAKLIREKWMPNPAPEWVAAVPSQRHSELIQDFARRLASALNLPFYAVLRKRGDTRQQKEMQNSSMQLRNLLKAFQIVDSPMHELGQGSAVRLMNSVKTAASPREEEKGTSRLGGSGEESGSVVVERRGEAPFVSTVQKISRRIATTFGAKPMLPSKPVLLVDDVVDSGWTLTLVSILLRLNGSGPVYPFALAKASLRGS